VSSSTSPDEGAGDAGPLPLAELRVLECGDTVAAAYAGRLLADLGASVVKVEPEGGDALRAAGPFAAGVPDRDMSVSFAYFNAGKRSVSLEALRADGDGRPWAEQTDVLIRCTTDGSDWVPDSVVAAARLANPGLIVCDMSTYGRQPGQPRGMSDLLASAASGLLAVSGTDPLDPASTPLRYRGELASIYAACQAVIATLGILLERPRSAAAQDLDISAQAAVASVLGTGLARYVYTGEIPVRNGTRTVAPWGIYDCRDGQVIIQCTEDDQWKGLLEVLGQPDWGRLEIFDAIANRALVTDVVNTYLSEALKDFDTADFIAAARNAGVPAAPIQTAADILAWDHLAERRYFQDLKLDNGHRCVTVRVPGRAWRFRSTPDPDRGPSPRLEEVRDAGPFRWTPRPPAVTADSRSDGRGTGLSSGPLAGVRVIDLTRAWAGPLSAMHLAQLGAEVIKVESSRRPDITRRLPPYADDVPGLNRSGYFNQYNQGKKSITLDLQQPAGLALLKDMVGKADVVIDNLRPGALSRMGLPHSEMARLNPRLVAVSLTGFGESGPERNRLAYGSIIDALSGASAANGAVGGGPTDLTMALADPTSGTHLTIATLAALLRARQTGAGETVECAMIEACLTAFPWPVLFRAATGCEAPVIGNRDEQRSPHGVFPCTGDNRWVAISVESDTEFDALASVIGRSELARSPKFASLQVRRVHENELDTVISTWTSTRTAEHVVDVLRQAGVKAELVMSAAEVCGSPALEQRGFFAPYVHPEIGIRPLPGVAWMRSRSPLRAEMGAPVIGQHTREVLASILGLDDGDLDDLEEQGVLR
jgi:crotonobetainyl-CoA:carnitine CoA-transferase CaiB-like acyl-CoA transferase